MDIHGGSTTRHPSPGQRFRLGAAAIALNSPREDSWSPLISRTQVLDGEMISEQRAKIWIRLVDSAAPPKVGLNG